MSLPLFNTDSMDNETKIDYMMKLIQTKCSVCFLTMGINHSRNGKTEFNLFGTVKNHAGESFTISQPSEDFGDMLTNAIEQLQSITPTKK